MEYIKNEEKMLQAMLFDERLMKFGGYSAAEVGNIYECLDSDNCVINTVAQIVKRTNELDPKADKKTKDSLQKEIWKQINVYLKGKL